MVQEVDGDIAGEARQRFTVQKAAQIKQPPAPNRASLTIIDGEHIKRQARGQKNKAIALKLPKHLQHINLDAAGINVGSRSHFVAVTEGHPVGMGNSAALPAIWSRLPIGLGASG
jgi:hypothetical protein